jgi:alkanesulfonate monooxygenase SsuD/methylene tetrahydromethanopterin reductase-like flavin-dependent oxidoreductase (luciferase family)
LPNYAENLRWLGHEEADDRMIDAVVAWGDEEAIAARVREHLDAGADHVCIQPIGDDDDELGLDQLRRLAPALVGPTASA